MTDDEYFRTAITNIYRNLCEEINVAEFQERLANTDDKRLILTLIQLQIAHDEHKKMKANLYNGFVNEHEKELSTKEIEEEFEKDILFINNLISLVDSESLKRKENSIEFFLFMKTLDYKSMFHIAFLELKVIKQSIRLNDERLEEVAKRTKVGVREMVFRMYPKFKEDYSKLKDAKVFTENRDGTLKWEYTKTSLTEYFRYRCLKKDGSSWLEIEKLFKEVDLQTNAKKANGDSPKYLKIVDILGIQI